VNPAAIQTVPGSVSLINVKNMTSKLLLALLATFIATTVGAEKRLPTVSDGEALRYAYSPRIKPDGSLVVYFESDAIYAIEAAGGEPRLLTSKASSAWSPTWSDDGESLYFMSDRSGDSQLWKLSTDRFGEALQVTFREGGIAGGRLSPDESQILLNMADRDVDEQSAEDESVPPPFVITRRHFKRDAGEGYLTDADTRHLYRYDIEADELTQLTSGTDNESGGAWSPDGSTIVYVSDHQPVQDERYRTDLWLIASEGGEPVRLTNSNEQKYAPAFSPDGETIAYLSAGDGVYSVPHITILPAAGGEPRTLTTSLDRWIGGFRFSDDGRYIYFTFDDAGSTKLGRVRLSNGRIERIVDGDVGIRGFDMGPGSTLALVMGGRNDIPDVHLLRGERTTRLTDLNRDYFDEVLVGEKRKVSFSSSDGTRVEAFLTFPPGYNPASSYPAILNIHGGPVGQFSWGYAFGPQFWAANGYVIIEPNPRGSTGFGEDFIRAIFKTWGIPDYGDVIAAVDYAVDQGIADPDRLAVTGYSYGGYLTNVVITETTRFKAAASGAGHSLIEANFGHDIYQHWYNWELGRPWEDRENYDRLSPFLRVGRVETPTLFLGGRIDWNVPILNAELMYQALHVRGIDTGLVVYPDAHHGGWPDEYEQDYLVRVIDWFDKHTSAD
jgi:dipeptidyl aminopeptidase/acylaminoacyl peptidase